MMGSRLLAIAIVGTMAACTENTNVSVCDGGPSDVVCSLTATSMTISANDGGADYHVTIDAVIPHLQGTTKAFATTSTGTVGGAGPGTDFSFVLTPKPNAAPGSGEIEGAVEWLVPPQKTARLDVRIEEASTAIVNTSP